MKPRSRRDGNEPAVSQDPGRRTMAHRRAGAAAIAACSGATALLIGLLPVCGINLMITEGISVGAIASMVVVGSLYRRPRRIVPVVLALAGFALIVGVVFELHNRMIELMGLALLAATARWQ
jgi:hypothetical protein